MTSLLCVISLVMQSIGTAGIVCNGTAIFYLKIQTTTANSNHYTAPTDACSSIQDSSAPESSDISRCIETGVPFGASLGTAYVRSIVKGSPAGMGQVKPTSEHKLKVLLPDRYRHRIITVINLEWVGGCRKSYPARNQTPKQ